MKKKTFLFLTLTFLSLIGYSQILKPVKWSYTAKKTSSTEAIVYIKATIDEGWHLYSQAVEDGGPIKTTFNFLTSKKLSLVGKTIEPKPITKFESTFKMNVSYFEKSVIFIQKIKFMEKSPVLKGSVEFMVCNDKQCLPPETTQFNILVK